MTSANFATHLSEDSQRYIRFSRVGNIPLVARAGLDGGQHLNYVAQLAGCRWTDVREYEVALAKRTAAAARRVYDEADVRHQLSRLPFIPGDSVIAVGDSITADRLGWAEQFANLLALDPRYREVLFRNSGLSGSTTTDTVERLDTIRAGQPTWVLLAIGTNDARRQALLPAERLVSASETRRNLRLLRTAIESLGARLVAITPPPLNEAPSRAAIASDGLGSYQDDVEDVAEAVRQTFGQVVDLHRPLVFDPNDTTYMDADGIHCTLHGGTRILRALLARLSRLAA